MKDIAVKFDRQLCCHSIGQCVDEIVQHILYVRQQIPSLVNEILKLEQAESTPNDISTSIESKRQRRKSCQFADHFRQLRTSIREIFRSGNRDKRFEVALLLGDAPFNPKDIYFINYKFASIDDDEDDESVSDANSTRTASKCRGLHEKEFQFLSRSIVCGGHFDETKKISKSNCYVFVNARRDADLQSFGFLPRSDINLRRAAKIKPKLNVFSVSLTSEIVKSVGLDQTELIEDLRKLNLEDNSDLIWFMFEHPLVGF